jgi:hypothetical protein
MKEGQVSYSNNILLNLETIFKIDNKKTDAWRAGQASTHQSVKMTSIMTGLILNLKLMTIFHPDNLELVTMTSRV